MKPENWDTMSKEEKHADAMALLNSIRGRLVMGQAVAYAAEAMRKVEYPEESNIQDMESIAEALFEPFYSMYTPEGRAAQRDALAKLKA